MPMEGIDDELVTALGTLPFAPHQRLFNGNLQRAVGAVDLQGVLDFRC